MIPYIDMQLSIWGKWAVSRATKGIGYPSTCPMFKDAVRKGIYNSAPPLGVSIDAADNILDTDAAVQRLTPAEKVLAVEFYQIGGTATATADRLGIARQRLYDRLHAMHQSVLGHLNDVVAGC